MRSNQPKRRQAAITGDSKKPFPNWRPPPLFIVGDKHEAALILHRYGWTDPRLAAALSTCTATIFKWRARHKLKSVQPRTVIDQERAMELYLAGESDTKIAAVVGACQSGITRWRHRHNLPRNGPFTAGLSAADKRKGKALLRKGLSRREVCDALEVKSCTTVQKLRNEMRGETGLRRAGDSQLHRRQRALRLDPASLLERIKRAVGRRASPDICADAVMELCTAVLDGRVQPDQIDSEAPRFVSRALADFAPKYGRVSIDDRGEDGCCFGDLLVDEGAEAAVELAGAMAMEHG